MLDYQIPLKIVEKKTSDITVATPCTSLNECVPEGRNIKMLQKRATKILNKSACREPSNTLFIKLKALKFKDLVDLKTL